jgi:molecular chaperone GrpE
MVKSWEVEQAMPTDNEHAKAAEQEAQPGAAPESEAPSVDMEALRHEVQKLKEESAHHLDQWKRTAANLENYRKRVEKERAGLLSLGQATLIAQLLPVLDDLQRAFQTLPPALRSLTWTDGVALIERKLDMILEQYGLTEIEALGKPFDSALHQSVLQEETSEHPDGHVMAILQRGYMLHERVLRPAMVKVARNTQTQPTMAEEEPAEPAAQADSESGSATEEEAAGAQ